MLNHTQSITISIILVHAQYNIGKCYYRYMENLHIEGSQGRKEAITQAQCEAMCNASPLCHAFDFDTSANPWAGTRCWLALLKVEYGRQVDNYVREELCDPNGQSKYQNLQIFAIMRSQLQYHTSPMDSTWPSAL